MTNSPTESALEVRGLSVYYGKVRALDGVDLRVGDRQVVSLLGSNGAGKSTLLNALTSVVPARSGTVTMDGRDVTKSKTWDLVADGLVQVPEGRQVFSHLSVEQHLHLSARPPVGDRASFEPRDIFELFPRLKERRDVAVGNLSGGEQQMVVVGRALVTQPRVLLLDEPSLGLSPKLAQSVIAVVNTLRDAGVSVLLVEQNASLALSVSDHVYVLANGRVAASGTAEQMRGSSDIRRAYLGGHATSSRDSQE